MKNFVKTVLLLLTLTTCKENSISEADRKKAIELNNQAVEYLISGETKKAKELYQQAHDIDKHNLNYHLALVGIYAQEKEFNKAFNLLEQMPSDKKESVDYFQTKGNIFDLKEDSLNAKMNYKKALDLSEKVKIEDEHDLNYLVTYSVLETLAGNKDVAVERINSTLKLKWLSRSNIEYLETFRNEFEFYQGTGFEEFDSKKDITICTNNLDSLEILLNANHINVSARSSSGGDRMGRLHVSEKFRGGIEKLKLKTCE